MSTERSLSEEKDGRSAKPVVLVVDDDEDLADTCEYWLRDDYDVRVAYGGEDALNQIDETGDVVLLDRRMPKLSGDAVLEGTRAARARNQVSASATPGARRRGPALP